MEHSIVKRDTFRLRHDAIKQFLKHGIIFIDNIKSEVILADYILRGMELKLVKENQRRW